MSRAFEQLFMAGCKTGNLLKVKNALYNININGFLVACENGMIQVAQWIFNSTPIDICSDNDWAFRNACENGHKEVAEWLQSLKPQRYGITEAREVSEGIYNIQYELYPNNNGPI